MPLMARHYVAANRVSPERKARVLNDQTAEKKVDAVFADHAVDNIAHPEVVRFFVGSSTGVITMVSGGDDSAPLPP
jgi:hypothetical protein